MMAIIRNEEMDSLNQISCKQLKNRFRNMNYKPKFILGSDFDQQLLYDVSESEQSLSYSEPISKIDNEKIESKFKNAFKKKLDFSGVQY